MPPDDAQAHAQMSMAAWEREDLARERNEAFARSREAAAENSRNNVRISQTKQMIDALEEGGHLSKYAADKVRETLTR